MSLYKEALAQKKANRLRDEQLRKAAMQQAKLSMTAEARISALLDSIAKIFEDSNVNEVTFEVEDLSLSTLSVAISEGKFAEYNIRLNGNLLSVAPQIIEL